MLCQKRQSEKDFKLPESVYIDVTFSGFYGVLGMYKFNPYANFAKRSKYSNEKTVLGNTVYDSKKEASRACELAMLEKAGIIKNLERQKRFEIVPKTPGERAVYYVADFIYQEVASGKLICEDVKSEITKKNAAYIIKRKLFKYLYKNYEFREV